MIKTEEQRSWWFATHPEMSWSHRGGGGCGGYGGGNKDSSGVSPKDVDSYADEALKYETGINAELLKSLKFWFGTEFESKTPEEQHALLWGDDDASEDRSSVDKEKGEKTEPTFGDAVLKGIDNTLQDWQRWLGLGAPTAPRLPPKGTPERAEIDAARSQGIRAKKAEELADIRAGEKGSGVWSENELERIRQTGKFPSDTRWHHDPTVANRPDLASDPKVVSPLRGGTKGHLYDGHQGNFQNPKK